MRSAPRARRPRPARGSSSGRSSAGLSQAALETLAVVAYLGPVLAARDRAHPRRRGRLGRRRPRRARPDRRGRPRRRAAARPLPDDAALRARLRPREPLGSSRASTTSAASTDEIRDRLERSPSAAPPNRGASPIRRRRRRRAARGRKRLLQSSQHFQVGTRPASMSRNDLALRGTCSNPPFSPCRLLDFTVVTPSCLPCCPRRRAVGQQAPAAAVPPRRLPELCHCPTWSGSEA